MQITLVIKKLKRSRDYNKQLNGDFEGFLSTSLTEDKLQKQHLKRHHPRMKHQILTATQRKRVLVLLGHGSARSPSPGNSGAT